MSQQKIILKIYSGDINRLVRVAPLDHYLLTLEGKVVKKFIDNKSLTARLLMTLVIKPEASNRVRNALNNFDRNLKLNFDIFNDVVPHFLNIEIHPYGLGICCKPTNTGQYTNYTSFSPWRYKISWITNIIHRATDICD